ncbi:glycosyltransferase [Vogesella fluminis]|uniref:Glycosyl transferase n=1 Tax=Vogesella fluminis TaxID=1069161 RepID=A0ABQ3HCA3_9NEIS|nr:glycosyltransferase [Vogesella fluminis]GHD78421.1 glycosyl transferase [Vogesella fluminis]
MLFILLGAFFCSFVIGVLLVRFRHLHDRISCDDDLVSVQKFHAVPVPRIGGIPVMAGLVAGVLILASLTGSSLGLLLLAVAQPAFIAGLAEDLTKRVGPLARLLATFLAAALGFWLLDACLSRLDLPGVDQLLASHWFVSLLFTVFAVGGVAHSINIIDGYNGLAGMVSVFVLTALAYVAFKVHDPQLMGLCFAAVGAVLGFLLWNFPQGTIFAGDGGAYLIGFLIAELSVLLVARHPEVSPWFPLLLVIYPVFETLFSIYRRKFLQGRPVGAPDALHLHQMVYRRLVRWMVGSKEARHMTRRNSMTSPYLWALSSLSVVPAMLFWNNSLVLIACAGLFVLTYLYLYRMIVRFHSPRWMVLHRSLPRDKNTVLLSKNDD